MLHGFIVVVVVDNQSRVQCEKKFGAPGNTSSVIGAANFKDQRILADGEFQSKGAPQRL